MPQILFFPAFVGTNMIREPHHAYVREKSSYSIIIPKYLKILDCRSNLRIRIVFLVYSNDGAVNLFHRSVKNSAIEFTRYAPSQLISPSLECANIKVKKEKKEWRTSTRFSANDLENEKENRRRQNTSTADHENEVVEKNKGLSGQS